MTDPGFVKLVTRDGVPKRSLYTALVVGSILTAINQGDVILASQMPKLVKIGLNYLVPFCVATYGAVTMKRAMLKQRAERPAGEGG